MASSAFFCIISINNGTLTFFKAIPKQKTNVADGVIVEISDDDEEARVIATAAYDAG